MTPRTLIAGIGNIFLADDGFGVEVARQLAGRAWPEGVQVRDFGIRGMDLVYALLEDHDAVIFVDTVPLQDRPGTLRLIEPTIPEDGVVTLDTHGMDPVKVLGLARAMGAQPARILVVGCEPERIIDPDQQPDVVVELSEAVQQAIPHAIEMVEELVAEIYRPVQIGRR